MRWPRGRTRYHASIVSELAAFRPLPFVLEADGTRRELEAMLVAVGNGSTYGGGMRICPGARTDDGLLDVTVITRISRLTLIRLFPRADPGNPRAAARGSHLSVLRITISAPDVTGYADGEFVAPLPVTCTVEPAAARVLVP